MLGFFYIWRICFSIDNIFTMIVNNLNLPFESSTTKVYAGVSSVGLPRIHIFSRWEEYLSKLVLYLNETWIFIQWCISLFVYLRQLVFHQGIVSHIALRSSISFTLALFGKTSLNFESFNFLHLRTLIDLFTFSIQALLMSLLYMKCTSGVHNFYSLVSMITLFIITIYFVEKLVWS